MAERLRLTRTFGSAGWNARHAGDGGFVLAALGACLLRPGAALALRGLWRLARMWHDGIDAIDPAALRLAIALRRDVRLSGIRVHVEIVAPARPQRARTYRLALQGQRRAPKLPHAGDGFAWIVLALATPSRRTFAAMTAALRAAPRGTRLTIDIEAQDTRAPDTLRAGFPLRADARIAARDDWIPLIRATRIDVAGALPKDPAWTSSISPN